MNLLEINANKLFELLRTDPDNGLKKEDVPKNKAEFSTSKSSPKSFWAVSRSVFGNVMPVLFVALTAVSLRFGMNAGVWLTLALFATVSIFFRMFAARYSTKVSRLTNTVPLNVLVIRDGETCEIEYSQLVPGDILILGFGDVVPCDAIVLQQSTLRVSEVQLTGNSSPVLKLTQEDVIRGKGVPYYECLLFAGSVVVSGWAKVLVCNTGKDVFDKKNKLTTPSKHARRTRIFEISSFVSKQISLVWILVAFVMFIVGIANGYAAFDILLLTVTLAAASQPDLVLTLFDLILSVGSKRLFKKGCAIRDMSALDRMCDISCIIADNSRYFRTSSPKPNTVYVNGVKKKFRGGAEDDVRELFELAVAASVNKEHGMSYNGISVERSLINCAEEIGIGQQKLYEKYLLLEKRPFTEENGMSRVIVFKDSEFHIISIGSPSIVLKTCTHIEQDGDTVPMDEKERRAVRDMSRVIAKGNEGVVAIAVKRIEYKEGSSQINSDRGYSFKGYIGLHTSINADSARAVNVCHKANTDVVLMTSEGLSTSTGFATSLSILRDGDKVVESKELPSIDPGLFRADIKKYKVYVSLTPEEKARIASYRKEDGDIIAVTASTVEDLRLILESDVSFCPSEDADRAALQNSDVIMNGGFDILPECIKYARSIYRNTRHMLQYVMNFQFMMLFAFIMTTLFISDSVLTPDAVMAYSALIFFPLALAISTEGVRGNELKDNFGMQNLSINVQNIVVMPGICGLVSAVAVTLGARMMFNASTPDAVVGGSVFITMAVSAVLMAFAISLGEAFDLKAFKNKQLIVSSVIALGLTSLFVFVPPISGIIGISAPRVGQLLISIVTGTVPALVCIGINLVKKYVFPSDK